IHISVSLIRILLSNDRREKVDQVAVGVAKQHRPGAPWVVGRLQNKFTNQCMEPRTLSVDVLNLKIENYRPIGSRLCRSGIEKVNAALARNSQGNSRNSQLHIVFAAYGRNSKKLFIESRQGKNVACNQSCLS